ncbi:uncharacterized protein BYT42DRAFT_503082 [Radiomyces spectabilis]|uniref:uncharacterized protein n=1 Tax=Radiomyces spectabilis TaxID=64574 RepID=UPI00222082C0|nr:uncharacterized protein BYT42DRAFT_503082 [Radiomyces spectabilis]KAI8369531.1 hypothetical protein BYT42DRAFT_503082 [Radiomyces spectabilis]
MVQKVFSIEVTSAQPGETSVRRGILSPKELVKSPAEGVNTLFDILEYAAATYGDRPAFGRRHLEKTFEEEKEIARTVNGEEKREKKTWTYFQLSKYEYFSFKEGLATAKTVGAGLKHLGLTSNDKTQFFASTSFEWMMMAHGCFSQAITIATAYDTLGAEGLKHAINEVNASAIFINGDQLHIMQKIISDCPTLRVIVYREKSNEDQLNMLQQQPQVQRILSFDELLTLGKEHPAPTNKACSEDLACIMYTSGSTGNPKGVMLTHGNLVADVAGAVHKLQHLVVANDSLLTYLPLAHVFEFVVEHVALFVGLTLGYGSIRTLTEASVRNCKGDIQEFAPSIMIGVPQVWETIRKTILAKVAQRGPRVEAIFHGAVELKAYLESYGLPTGFLDRVVFKEVKKQLGGRLRYGISGGSPLSTETQRFLTMTLAPIVAGYGMTECLCSVMTPEQFELGQVGAPLSCVEVKLVDVPEAGYFATNKPHPQGEVWMRGPSITKGYYKRDDLTKETITEDGWLQTGDIGMWSDKGTLVIIDRKKNLVKLSNGEYIALEKMESVYKSSLLVENICVYADSLYPKPVALVVPIESQLRTLAAQHQVTIDDWQELCKHDKMRKVVLQVLQEQAQSAGLKGTEIISNVWLCDELWTTEMDLLTPAQKLKRHAICKKYSKELKAM